MGEKERVRDTPEMEGERDEGGDGEKRGEQRDRGRDRERDREGYKQIE